MLGYGVHQGGAFLPLDHLDSSVDGGPHLIRVIDGVFGVPSEGLRQVRKVRTRVIDLHAQIGVVDGLVGVEAANDVVGLSIRILQTVYWKVKYPVKVLCRRS